MFLRNEVLYVRTDETGKVIAVRKPHMTTVTEGLYPANLLHTYHLPVDNAGRLVGGARQGLVKLYTTVVNVVGEYAFDNAGVATLQRVREAGGEWVDLDHAQVDLLQFFGVSPKGDPNLPAFPDPQITRGILEAAVANGVASKAGPNKYAATIEKIVIG